MSIKYISYFVHLVGASMFSYIFIKLNKVWLNIGHEINKDGGNNLSFSQADIRIITHSWLVDAHGLVVVDAHGRIMMWAPVACMMREQFAHVGRLHTTGGVLVDLDVELLSGASVYVAGWGQTTTLPRRRRPIHPSLRWCANAALVHALLWSTCYPDSRESCSPVATSTIP
jgi:hypothetical protein